MAGIGSWALGLSLLVSLYAAIAAFVGARRRSLKFVESACNAIWAAAALVTLASLLLLYFLITHDFQVKYVYEYTSTHLPLIYRISAMWAGQQGSLLLWLWLLTILTVIVVQQRRPPGQVRPYLLVTLAITEAFLTLLLVATADPFATFSSMPMEGVGMLPLLENPGMVLHPPVLFLGYAAYTVPFAFAVAALMSGELDASWVKAMRRWNLFAWLSLGAGILIGAWWSYVELGWGGYWAWDPVENASLVPWLIGTASLHSAIMQERRGMHKVWNMVLPTLAFVLCLFATLVTRGGIIISDLHGFSRQVQPIAYYLLAFIAITLGGSLYLIYVRRRKLRDDTNVENLVSREALFWLVDVLFCGAALAVSLGTLYPALVEALRGTMVSLNTSFYNRSVVPMMTVIIALIGICPVIGWQRPGAANLRALYLSALAALVMTVVAFIIGVTEPFPIVAIAIGAFVIFSLLAMLARDWRTRRRSRRETWAKALVSLLAKAHRRYGAHLVHLAVVLIAIGIVGSTFKHEQSIALNPGEVTSLGGYSIQYEDYSIEILNAEPVTYQSRVRYSAQLSILDRGSRVSTLVPQKSYHWAMDTPWVTEVAIRSNWKEDIYIILASLEDSGQASFRMIVNPLVSWIWVGGVVLLVGTLVAAWPQSLTTIEEDSGAA